MEGWRDIPKEVNQSGSVEEIAKSIFIHTNQEPDLIWTDYYHFLTIRGDKYKSIIQDFDDIELVTQVSRFSPEEFRRKFDGVSTVISKMSSVNTSNKDFLQVINDSTLSPKKKFTLLKQTTLAMDDEDTDVDLLSALLDSAVAEVSRSAGPDFEDNSYTLLTEDDIAFLIKFAQLIVSEFQNSNYLEEYNFKTAEMIQERDSLKESFEEETEFIRARDLVEDSNADLTDKIYETVECIVQLTDTSIDIEKVFNQLELSLTAPLVGLYTPDLGHRVKTLKNIKSHVNDTELRDWVLNSKGDKLTIRKRQGLMVVFKVIDKWCTGYLTSKGIFNVTVNVNKFSVPPATLESITLRLKKAVQGIADSFIVQTVDVQMYTYSGNTEYINKEIVNWLLNRASTSKIFKKIKVLSTLFVSLEHVKTGKRVNVEDNHLIESKTKVTLHSVSTTEARLITTDLLGVFKVKDNTNTGISNKRDTRVSKESGIKALRRTTGVTFDSRICQKDRQPVRIDSAEGIDKNRVVNFKGELFYCPTEQYKYMGFTSKDGNPCCFKKPQESTVKFAKFARPERLDTIVRPSNYKVVVDEGDGGKEYLVLLNTEDNKYYYLDYNDVFTEITDPKVLDRIETRIGKLPEGETIFLPPVSLNSLTAPSKKGACAYKPSFTWPITELNDLCRLHPKHPTFGYNAKSVPCCFGARVGPPASIPETQASGPSTNVYYIKTTSKVLEPQRVGTMLPSLKGTVLEGLFRMGVNRPSGLLNAVARWLSLVNASDLRMKLYTHLSENPSVFGSLGQSSTTLKKYLEKILDTESQLDFKDIGLLVSKVFNMNLVVIDVVNDQPRLLCGVPIKQNRDTCVVLKYGDIHELVIQDSSKLDSSVFKDTSDIILAFVTQLLTGCKKRYSEQPESIKPAPNAKKLVERFRDKVKYQVDNGYYKTTLLVFTDGLLFPVRETGLLPGIETIAEDKVPLCSLERLVIGLDEYLGEGIITGVTTTDGMIDSAMTIYGIQIPVLPEKYNKQFPEVAYRYYTGVNALLNPENREVAWESGAGGKLGVIGERSSPESKYIRNVETLKAKIIQVQANISTSMTGDIVEAVKKIVLNTRLSRQKKVVLLKGILPEYTGPEQNPSELEFCLSYIATEILNDTVDFNFLNGKLYGDISKSFIYREGEVLLTSLDDFLREL